MTASQQRASDRPPRIAAAAVAGQTRGDRGRPRLALLCARMPVLPALLTLAASLWGIGSASFWRDEAATLTATKRSLPEMIRMLGHVDAVHGTYYLVMWPLAHLFGQSEFVMRLPSAIAMAAAAFGTAVIGRRLVGWQTGLLAGLVFAALPMTSRYGQEARSYALVTAVAVLASYLLVRAIDDAGPRLVWGYGVSLVAVGFLNMFGLLIVPAHGITLALARRHGSLDGSGLPGSAPALADPPALVPAGQPGSARRPAARPLRRPTRPLRRMATRPLRRQVPLVAGRQGACVAGRSARRWPASRSSRS